MKHNILNLLLNWAINNIKGKCGGFTMKTKTKEEIKYYLRSENTNFDNFEIKKGIKLILKVLIEAETEEENKSSFKNFKNFFGWSPLFLCRCLYWHLQRFIFINMKKIEEFNKWFEEYFYNTQTEDSPFSYKDIKLAFFNGYIKGKKNGKNNKIKWYYIWLG